jgi:hypothetical protein
MILLTATIGLVILVWLNSKMIKVLKNYRNIVNARRTEDLVTYKLSKLKSNISNLKNV